MMSSVFTVGFNEPDHPKQVYVFDQKTLLTSDVYFIPGK